MHSFFSRFVLLWCVCSAFSYAYRNSLGWRRLRTTERYCVDKVLTPINRFPEEGPSDSDSSWRTAPSTIIPIDKEKFEVRPDLITFDACNTLIQPSQSVGKWYREALNSACNMQIRLPRPAFFTASFERSFKEMSTKYPCYGANAGMTAKQWWFETVKKTYQGTEALNQIEPQELEVLLPGIFDVLYNDIFGSKRGWVLKEDVVYTLTKLRDWRDQGAGPKFGVVSNFDDRLPRILADLGIADMFNFIVTSYNSKCEKPQREIFDLALERGHCSNPQAAYHVGDSLTTDVAGAIAAGWSPLRYRENFDDDFPDWTDVDTEETADEGSERRKASLKWGRRDTTTGLEWTEIWGLDDVLSLFGLPEDDTKPISTTLMRGIYED